MGIRVGEVRGSGPFFVGLRKALRFHKHLANNTVSRNCLLKHPRINNRPPPLYASPSRLPRGRQSRLSRDHRAVNFSDDGTRVPLFSTADN